MAAIYLTEHFPELKRSRFLYQLTKNRKLTDIPHRHDFYEFVYILNGIVTHCIDGEKFSMQANDFCLLAPQNEHYFCAQTQDAEVFSLSVTQEKYAAARSLTETDARCGAILCADSDSVAKGAAQLPFLPERERMIRLNLLFCRLYLLAADTAPTKNETAPQLLQRALQEACKPQNIANGVAALTAVTGYSRAHLCRLTKRCFGKTPYQLMHAARMRIIRESLLTTDKTLETIADEVGYASLSQFYAAVKNHFGISPGEIRRKNKYPL